MKKILFFLFFFSSVAYALEATKTVIVNKPSKYVYRVILESLNKCIPTGLSGLTTYVGSYYDDNDTASIYLTTFAQGRGYGDSYKLKLIDKTHTEISYFMGHGLFVTNAFTETTLSNTLKWIEQEEADCNTLDSIPAQAAPTQINIK